MRWLVIVLLLGACSAFNVVDESSIPTAPETCDDAKDNNGNGLVDCADSECFSDAFCAEDTDEKCTDGQDNDGNGLIDCRQASCRSLPSCVEGDSEASCGDKIDNDLNGLFDCRDPACARWPDCREASEITCQGGVDDDFDGLTDCEDPTCAWFFGCAASAPIQRDEPCVGRRPGYKLEEFFSDESLPDWQVFSTDRRDRPETKADGDDRVLDLRGRDGVGFAGIASQQTFQFGRDQALRELEVSLRYNSACADCGFAIDLHTRRDWGDGVEDGSSVASFGLSGTQDGLNLSLSCTYHEQSLPSSIDVLEDLSLNSELALSMRTDEGKLKMLLDENELCEVPLGDAAEPPVRLVLRAQGSQPGPGESSARDPWLVVQSVSLIVPGQNTPEQCRGLREGLVPDGFCDDELPNAHGTSRPRVISRPASEGEGQVYDLFMRYHNRINQIDVGYSQSNDGRKAFSPPIEQSILQPSFSGDWHASAFVFDDEEQRFFTWAVRDADGETSSLYGTGLGDAGPTPAVFQRGEDLVLEADPDPWGLVGEAAGQWIPETVVLHEGRYLGWFVHPGPEGRRAIFWAESEDGIRWRADPDPVLEGGGAGAWDATGVWEPAVIYTGDYWMMAYVSDAFGVPDAIGIAVCNDADGRCNDSEKNERWVRHTSNPLVRGEDVDFDVDGVSEPSLLLVGQTLRIWYTATVFGQLACSDGARHNGVQRRLGLTELQVR